MESGELHSSNRTVKPTPAKNRRCGEGQEHPAVVQKDHFTRLGDELLIDILRRVSFDTGKTALHCLEVCKRWEKMGRWSVAILSLQGIRPRHFVPYLSKFWCLTHVTLEKCNVGTQGWSELSGRCRNLSEVRFQQVNPRLTECDIMMLLMGRGNSLKHLQISNSMGCHHLPCLDSLTSLLSLDLSDNSLLQSLSPLHSLTSLTALSLQNCLCLHTAPGLESLVQLRKLSVEGCLSFYSAHQPYLLGRLPLLENLSISSPNLSNPIPLGEELWEDWIGVERDDAVLPQLPALSHLQHLSLSHSWNAESLPDMSNLSGHLRSITILQFPNLTTIDALTQLHTLQRLEIHCSCVQDFRALQSLKNLEDLVADECDVSEILFTSALSKLTSIKMEACERLRRVSFLGNLHELRKLSFRGAFKLSELRSLGALSSLDTLDLWGCCRLKYCEIIPPICRLADLKKLSLNVGPQPNNRPLQITLPTTLEVLGLDSIEDFHTISELPCVQHLIFRYINGVRCLQEWSAASLTALISIRLESCPGLTTAAPLGSLSTLVLLTIEECSSLVTLPDFCRLTSLKKVHLNACDAILELPPIHALPQLNSLSVTHCRSLEHVPFISALPCLSRLSFEESSSLAALSVLNDLPALGAINLRHCRVLRGLPDLQSLTSLHALNLEACLALEELPCLSTALERIDVRDCLALARLPPLRGLPWLRELHVLAGLTLKDVPAAAVITRHPFREMLLDEPVTGESGSDESGSEEADSDESDHEEASSDEAELKKTGSLAIDDW